VLLHHRQDLLLDRLQVEAGWVLHRRVIDGGFRKIEHRLIDRVVPLTEKQSVEKRGMDEVASKLTSLRNSVNLKSVGRRFLLERRLVRFALSASVFSMATSRYDVGKNDEGEANAIGSKYVRAGLLSVADAAKVRNQLRRYLDLRIAIYRPAIARNFSRSTSKPVTCETKCGRPYKLQLSVSQHR